MEHGKIESPIEKVVELMGSHWTVWLFVVSQCITGLQSQQKKIVKPFKSSPWSRSNPRVMIFRLKIAQYIKK